MSEQPAPADRTYDPFADIDEAVAALYLALDRATDALGQPEHSREWADWALQRTQAMAMAGLYGIVIGHVAQFGLDQAAEMLEMSCGMDREYILAALDYTGALGWPEVWPA